MLTSHFSSLVMTPAIVKKLMGVRVNPVESSNGAAGAICNDNNSGCSSSGSNGSLKMMASSTSTANTSTSSTSSSSSNMVSISAANMSNHNKLCEKAIRALVKKLKKTPGALEELEKAITNRDPNTKCITIPLKSSPQQDRMSRKALPHVVYCRIWRFADLQNCNELKSLPHCQHGYSHHHQHHNHHNNINSSNGSKRDDSAIICINPYHYTRCEQNQQPANLNSNNTIGVDSNQMAVTPSLLTVYVPKPKHDSQMMVDQPTSQPLMGANQAQGQASVLKSDIPSQQQQQQLSMTSDLIHSSNFMIAASPSPISTPSPPLMTNNVNGNGYNTNGNTSTAGNAGSNNNNNSYFNINSPLSPPTSSSSPPNLANYNMSLSRSPPSIAMLQQFSPFLSEDDSSEINDISPSPICGKLSSDTSITRAVSSFMSFFANQLLWFLM